MSFDLRVSGGRIEGEIKRPGRDGNVQTARLSLKRPAEK